MFHYCVAAERAVIGHRSGPESNKAAAWHSLATVTCEKFDYLLPAARVFSRHRLQSVDPYSDYTG